jgi:spore coat polysaccharide biosynthesis protein SpsF
MKVVAIVQARMGSTRLPGKVMLDLEGLPILVRVINRLRRAAALHEIVIATSTQPSDAIISELCHQNGWNCFRGSEDDVLDRYYFTAVRSKADVIVRITSDCPLIEPSIVDRVVQEFLERQPSIDYASNCLPPRTFPQGLDTEVLRFDVLERAWREDKNQSWREHVTPYVYRHPELFHIHAVANHIDYSYMRWTVDTPQDLTFVRKIYDHFRHDHFSWSEVLSILEQHPSWLEINRGVEQKVV